MKCKKLGNQLLLFTFKTQKEITMTFFRMEEYYESPLKGLFRNHFTVWDFLNESMDEKGNINYFSKWIGFNIPGNHILDWIELHLFSLTPKEEEVIRHINNKIDVSKPFYIIAANEKNTNVMDHEIAHALYYLNPVYKVDMDSLTHSAELHFPENFKRLRRYLKDLGYNEKVYNDEIQAYLATEKKSRLKDKDDFNLKCNKQFMLYVEDYRTILQEFKSELDNVVEIMI